MGRADDLFTRLESDGEAAVDEFIVTRASEELYLDFKRSSDNGAGRRLSDNDRNNLAKAISGFGNSEGGVVVWGVDCSEDIHGADVARMKVPLEDPARYRSWLEGAVSGCTVPPHQGVRHLTIPARAGESGFVATLIPQSNAAPHQVVGRMVYFIRAGSDFVPAPHAVLAGMFGRRPQPHVYHTYTLGPARLEAGTVRCQVGIVIRNDGPGIAGDLFANVHLRSSPGTRCEIGIERTDPNNWAGVWSFGQHISMICVPGFRLPPEAHVQPLVLNIGVSPPFTAPIEIEGMVGSGGSPPYRFRLFNGAANVETVYKDLTARIAAGGDDAALLRQSFGSKLLGMDDEG